MSNLDYKRNLKKLDYPQRASEALLRIESLMASKKQDHCLDLIAEFVFLEKKQHPHLQDMRNKLYGAASVQQMNQNSLTLIQEFQLVVVLVEFFSRDGHEMTKNAIFLSLFSGSAVTPYARSRVLAKLVSTSITGSIGAVLRAAGTWMQQLGPTSPPCIELAQRLVEDFIIFSINCSHQLRLLPTVAPRFTINFMTAVVDVYLNDSKNGQLTMPPDMLLDVFTEWVSENPTLCLTNQPPLALPPGAIPMPIITPLAGLIRWSVLAPMSNPFSSAPYSRLHLAVLQSLMQALPTTTPSQTNRSPSTSLHALQLGQIIVTLKQRSEQISESGGNPETDENIQLSLERFAQSIQLALQTRLLTGNTTQLLCRLETLPKNPLLQIIIKAQKS